jgi:hypothetical protein
LADDGKTKKLRPFTDGRRHDGRDLTDLSIGQLLSQAIKRRIEGFDIQDVRVRGFCTCDL